MALLAGLCLAAGCGEATPSWHGSSCVHAVQAADFALENQFGRPFELLSQSGKATLLCYGYTQSPDVCPTTVANTRWLFEELGDSSERLTFALVTIDLERDRPAVLAEYLSRFHPAFLGLTGDPQMQHPTGAAVGHARLQLRGDMTHPGMAPILREAGEDRPGEYPVGFEWTMAGDWILTVQGDLPDGRQLLRSIPIRVEPNPAAP